MNLQQLTLLQSQQSAINRAYLATSPIVFYPLDEASGTVAYDRSGNGFHSTYENISVGNATFPDGSPCSSWDTATSMIQMYPTGFYPSLNKSEGTLEAWVKAVDASLWSNGNFGAIWEAYHSGQTIRIVKTATLNQLRFTHDGNGTIRQLDYNTGGLLTWFHVALTWSIINARVRAYLNGSLLSEMGAPTPIDAALTTDTMCIGRFSNSTSYRWYGNIRNFALHDRELMAAEIASHAPVQYQI